MVGQDASTAVGAGLYGIYLIAREIVTPVTCLLKFDRRLVPIPCPLEQAHFR